MGQESTEENSQSKESSSIGIRAAADADEEASMEQTLAEVEAAAAEHSGVLERRFNKLDFFNTEINLQISEQRSTMAEQVKELGAQFQEYVKSLNLQVLGLFNELKENRSSSEQETSNLAGKNKKIVDLEVELVRDPSSSCRGDPNSLETVEMASKNRHRFTPVIAEPATSSMVSVPIADELKEAEDNPKTEI